MKTPASRPGRGVRQWWLTCALAALLLSGCASANLQQARSEFYAGNPDQASAALTDPEAVSGRERLLYFMEKGLILHDAGRYPESIRELRKASALIQEQEIISASRQAASLVTSEWLTDYKGEYAERLLVHTYLMMNYLLISDPEAALVEGKQALEVYDRYPSCAGDVFTRALIAHCFEALGDINGAYIEYKKLADLLPSPELVAEKLCGLGARLGFDDEVAIYREFLPEPVAEDPEPAPAAELLVFAAQGRAPVKIPQNIVLPPSIRFSFATYEDVTDYFYPLFALPPAEGPVGSPITTDVGQVLKASLGDRLAQIIAKETARVIAKEAIAHQVDNDLAEILVRIVFFILEEPDTRSWQTLPAYLTLARVPLREGFNRIDPGGGMPALDITVGPKPPRYFYRSLRSGIVR